MRINFRIISFLAVLLMGFSAFAADFDRVVAVVNGANLSAAELGQEIQQILPYEQSFHSGVSAEKLKVIEVKALEKLVEKELQYQDGVAKGIRISEAKLAEEIEGLAGQFPSKADYRKAVEQSGFNDASLKRFIERNYVSQVIKQREVDDKVLITDDAVTDHYAKNKGAYLKPEEFRASHILIKVDPAASGPNREKLRAKADNVLKRIKAGADFAKIASEESDDLTRIKGGDMGFFHAGRTVAEFDDTLKKMKVGEVSNVIESLYGYHIIKLTDKKEAHQLPFSEVREKIRSSLETKERSRLFDQWMSGLRSKARIVYPEKRPQP